ncbi:Cmx/CmrA family chloramphenicol efflux MFS transporter [Streptomyces sp. cg2]|uniref:Cmx/CmrA family chloramphenicol efflux MFS transporter n=1 Tax=Streptomyces sp. cg2 TaxID=3238799 RepID=UPI0034E227D4
MHSPTDPVLLPGTPSAPLPDAKPVGSSRFPSRSPLRPWSFIVPIALFVLGLTIFGLGTTEFMIAGLLPEMADAFDVSIPTAGILISAFAVGAAIGAPAVALVSARLPRKATLVAILIVFLAGQTMAATAQSYQVLLVARVVTAVVQSAFFGIGAVVAADLVPPSKRASAIAVMFGGLTISTIAGVPLGAFLGQHWGWRSPFWVVNGLALIGLIGVITSVPSHKSKQEAGVRKELSAFRSGRVWLGLVTTALSQAALFGCYSYITPLLTDITGFSSAVVPVLLVLFGVGTFCGSVLGGRFADRNLMRTLWIGMVLLATSLALFSATAHNKVLMTGTVIVFGIAGFLINPGLQTRVLNEAKGAATLASAGNISAFNIGNAAGPWVAGLAISGGHGYLSPSWVGLVFALGALATALVGTAADAAERRRGSAAPGCMDEEIPLTAPAGTAR